jgi:hypothetical protein
MATLLVFFVIQNYVNKSKTGKIISMVLVLSLMIPKLPDSLIPDFALENIKLNKATQTV